MIENSEINPSIKKKLTKSRKLAKEALEDYRICRLSREVSLLGRREVLTGKAKFGILGDGKELPQVAMARAFKKGDWRSGYYRDQTFMFALGLSTIEAFFAQLYADAENDPFSGGRQMNSHYASPAIDAQGNWTNHLDYCNVSSDISCTGGQMARGLGLAFASKQYRNIKELSNSTQFSNNGNEICFVTIGDASTSEGIFWESMNAAAVIKAPMIVSVWDDGYGISVPKKFQTVKQSISEALEGMRINEKGEGIEIHRVNGWDYLALKEVYQKASKQIRKDHTPVLIHVEELTQPQGHSTSGSHERYKTTERLQWEKEMDCILALRKWIIKEGIATEQDLDDIDAEVKKEVREAKQRAWKAYTDPIKKDIKLISELGTKIADESQNNSVSDLVQKLNRMIDPTLAEALQMARRISFEMGQLQTASAESLRKYIQEVAQLGKKRYETHLYSHSSKGAINVSAVKPIYSEESKLINGYQILNAFFDFCLKNNPSIVAFGEDVGKIGDVNQGFAGLQDKYGVERVFDTGIREWSIMGQAIGLAMRGFRPIVEIQYLDYLVYGLEPLTDDLATLRYRSNGQQQAPAIIRTRGHRLEGIWHAGSPMGMLINSLRGMYICVPRNMTKAIGFYNTLLQSDDPALVIECLNGYRLKEKLPDNLGEYTEPLGVPETLQEGTDLTIVTYGSCVRVVESGIKMLQKHGISVELIDVQTLLPFDLEGRILTSLKKTNRILFVDEDVPGGATAYMMQEVLEKQGGYEFLDAKPATLTAVANRSPYGSDGDYFSKPNPEDVFEAVYKLMHESDPGRFPIVF